MDALVKGITVRDTTGFNPATLTSSVSKVVTFYVGNNGPFTLTYAADKYNQQQVNADIQKEVDTLRAIGAIPQSTGY